MVRFGQTKRPSRRCRVGGSRRRDRAIGGRLLSSDPGSRTSTTPRPGSRADRCGRGPGLGVDALERPQPVPDRSAGRGTAGGVRRLGCRDTSCAGVAVVTTPEFERLQEALVRCRRCPRLVAWREEVGVSKRAAFADHDYWARPVPMLGLPSARLLIVGLAPGAHGSNRTGRMFTGDRSGEWLFRSAVPGGFREPAGRDQSR